MRNLKLIYQFIKFVKLKVFQNGYKLTIKLEIYKINKRYFLLN